MPRQPRQTSGTDIYHVMMRGINRQDIFEDKEERNIIILSLLDLGAGLRQLPRLTGVTYGVINKLNKKR